MLSDSLLCMIGSSAEESMRLQLLACHQASKGRKQVNIVQAKQGGSVPNRSKE